MTAISADDTLPQSVMDAYLNAAGPEVRERLKAAAEEKAAARARMPKPWEQTVEEYIGPCSVTQPIRRDLPQKDVEGYAQRCTYKHTATSPRAPDYTFHYNHLNSFKIVHEPTGEIAGTFAGTMVYISPKHRGKALMREMYVIFERAGIKNDHRLLTPGSLGALRGAHRVLVQDALNAGETIPLNVLSQYTKGEGGNLRLRTPYGRDECNTYRDQLARRASANKVIAALAGQTASFIPRHEHSPDADAHMILSYVDGVRPRRMAGLRLAEQAALAGGGVIRVVTSSYMNDDEQRRWKTAFCAVVNDVAIDALGAVPVAEWTERCVGVGLLDREMQLGFFGTAELAFETHDFASAADCVNWMRAEGVKFHRRTLSDVWMPELMMRNPQAELRAVETATQYAAGLRDIPRIEA